MFSADAYAYERYDRRRDSPGVPPILAGAPCISSADVRCMFYSIIRLNGAVGHPMLYLMQYIRSYGCN